NKDQLNLFGSTHQGKQRISLSKELDLDPTASNLTTFVCKVVCKVSTHIIKIIPHVTSLFIL
ncbi:hypothetical protein ACA081_00930, partial [Candidatus Hodgkinia cicadicola]